MSGHLNHFVAGMASLVDVNPRPTRRVGRPVTGQAGMLRDGAALGGDWDAVGSYLRTAIDHFEPRRLDGGQLLLFQQRD